MGGISDAIDFSGIEDPSKLNATETEQSCK